MSERLCFFSAKIYSEFVNFKCQFVNENCQKLNSLISFRITESKDIFPYSPDLKSLTTAVPSLTIMKIKELREEISPVVSRHTSLLTFTCKIEVLSSDNLAITNYQFHSRINLSRFILNAYFDKNRASTYLTLLGILTLENS